MVEREEVEPYLQTQNLKRQTQPEGPKQEHRHRGLCASFFWDAIGNMAGGELTDEGRGTEPETGE